MARRKPRVRSGVKRVMEMPITSRLRAVVIAAAQGAQADGRPRIELGDLHEALRSGSRRGWHWRWGRVSADLLGDDIESWWRAGEREAARAGHPYLAPEHLLLVCASEIERARLLDELGSFSGPQWWRPRGPRSAARTRGRELTAERQRQARRDGADR
jgi:hypothetical protein